MFSGIFLDTGAFIARYLERDRHHREAVVCFDQLERDRTPILTSSFVLDETFTLLGRRAGYRFAAARARAIYSSQAISVLRPDADDEHRALTYFEKFADQQVSFTDCVSFALMKDRGLTRVFAFDFHFTLAGFDRLPASGSIHEPASGMLHEPPPPPFDPPPPPLDPRLVPLDPLPIDILKPPEPEEEEG